jgi:toxin ParE1/3/4
MATMNVSLPEPMKAWVERQAEGGMYGNASDYIRDLIRKDQERKEAIATLQAAITEGLESGNPQLLSSSVCGSAMSSDKQGQYRLAPRALADLDDIWRYSAETWSIDQADRYIDDLTRIFETIAAMPTLARERLEFKPPVRIHVHERHLIVYTVTENQVTILRLLGGRQDWISILKAADQ